MITANENLSVWARRSGLEIVSLPDDSEALLRSREGIEMLARGDTMSLNREGAKRELAANLAVCRRSRQA